MTHSDVEATGRLRSPIVTVLGHIDHGKTSLLDRMRGSAVQHREAAGITQHIGASFFPTETIVSICGNLLKAINTELKIDGLLFIDTPGHEAYLNLRRRGGAIADIAILVIDINEGPLTQTYESLKILRAGKTPFLIAANKLDKVPGWKPMPDVPLIQAIKAQSKSTQMEIDRRLYEIVGALSANKIPSERFDRIKDFTKSVAIVPTSAKTGEGIPELLMVLAGLTQQYMQDRLRVSTGPAKGVVLEVREETGLGVTLDTIIYEGVLRKTDTVVVGGLEDAIVARIRALLLPRPLDEIRDPREKFTSVDEVHAAAGVKIVSPDIHGAVAGAPVFAVDSPDNIEEIKRRVREEVGAIRVHRDSSGIVLKADTLGSLEAVTQFLQERKVPVRVADVGPIVKRDVLEARAAGDTDPLNAVILGFNVKVAPGIEDLAAEYGVEIFLNDVIYRLYDDYYAWLIVKKEQAKAESLGHIVRPGKIELLPDYIFRHKDPAIVGVRVYGVIRPKVGLINGEGRRVGTILQIQDRGVNIDEATDGMEVAVSIRGPTIGRQVKPGEILYVDVPDKHIIALRKKFRDDLTQGELDVLDEITEIRRAAGAFV
ncbi:MAG: translation initiation factor IF-2 [Candidatus Thorarchaeota archaeon]|nr:MAG: translation initiation factor IF-2 [Candidatus Thorarchaeota archaeon]RLI62291.1 MAG: translation initiation factor IF-2 [Candidatus Thorarchaeota archaeon]